MTCNIDLHVSLHVCFKIQFAGIVPVFLEFSDSDIATSSPIHRKKYTSKFITPLTVRDLNMKFPDLYKTSLALVPNIELRMHLTHLYVPPDSEFFLIANVPDDVWIRLLKGLEISLRFGDYREF